MERLQNAIKRAAEIREKSWCDKMKVYKTTLKEAADQAAGEEGFDARGTYPVYMLLKTWWNDTLDWADNKGW